MQPTTTGCTALHIAPQNGHLDALRALVVAGAEDGPCNQQRVHCAAFSSLPQSQCII